MLTPWLFACAISLTACAGMASDNDELTARRDQALAVLQEKTGAPVTVEVNEAGTTRVVQLTPKFTAPTRAADPAIAAARFLGDNHDAFQISGEDAASFVATRVDAERERGVTHVALQRTVGGIPVFQGGVQVALDNGNNVLRATADELYKVGAPTNRALLSPAQAAEAAARQFGVSIKLGQATVEGQATSFEAAGTADPIKVEPRIFQVAPGDDRIAHQVLLSWNDEHKQAQYQLVLIDAETGAQLFADTLVNTITGRVFSIGNQPAPSDTTDHRTVVSFNGDPTASPLGWVTAPANKTIGNNAVAATDLNGNNTVGANETQPTAANGSFDFAYSPATDSASEAAASVTNAFFYVNDHHDRTYALGFTEAAGNFQTNNNGKGGKANDPVNVDSQDGSGTNNANFSTPPDGSRPRMQMFLFNIIHGTNGRPRQDGDFDGTVVYHENTHGLSNRLVGAGATTCLNHLQSGGMGEGWSDFVAGSFLNNPVIGAYVTGNTTTGIRQQSMGNSKWTYNDVKNGTLAEVHDAGELWSAALWDVRKALGQHTTELIVVQGMKDTPCHPTMLNARDGIIQADQTLNGGANKCAIWHAFAGRLMGTGASSPNDSSTTAIVTSTAVPAGC
jgi:extracellular elastinolytic metalloproteinase